MLRSDLSLLLLLLFVNDLNAVIKSSNILPFADDLKLYYPICTLYDCFKFEEELNVFLSGVKENIQLRLNINTNKHL